MGCKFRSKPFLGSGVKRCSWVGFFFSLTANKPSLRQIVWHHHYQCCKNQWDHLYVWVCPYSVSRGFSKSTAGGYQSQALPTPWGPGDALWFRATFIRFNGCGKDTHGEQFPGDAISHFCCLCEWEIILKILYSFFFPLLYFELCQLAIVHFTTWVYVPRLAVSPNLAGKQQKPSGVIIGEKGMYSALGKLLLAAGWIVYHPLVPLFLDASSTSVLTRGEWQYWSRDSSIKHGRERRAEELSCHKRDTKLRFSSLLYNGVFCGILLPPISPHCLYLLLRDLIWNQPSSISETTEQLQNK